MFNQLRRRTSVFWNNPRCYWGLLLWGLQRQKTRKCRTIVGWQIVREQRSGQVYLPEYPAEDVAGFWKPAHINGSFGVLLCDGLLHRGVCDGKRGGNSALWQTAGEERFTVLWRTLQNCFFLRRYGVCHDIHGRILAAIICGPKSVQIYGFSDVYYRRGSHSSLLHWLSHSRQWRRLRCFRNLASLQGVPNLQILQTFPRSPDPRLYVEILRLRIRFPCFLVGNGHHHFRHCHVLCWEKCWRHHVHIHTSGLLVHHRHNDNIGVSSWRHHVHIHTSGHLVHHRHN